MKPQFSLNLDECPNGPGNLRLDLAEREFAKVLNQIEDRVMHHSDRPEIELRILSFLEHALGPTTEGIAAMMGISQEAAVVHLEALFSAGRIWGQPVHGGEMAWHLSSEGRHFLAQRGSLTNDLAA